jgi:hypothetical protein
MQINELKELISAATDDSNIILVAEEQVYSIQSVNVTDGNVLVLIEPITEASIDNDKKTTLQQADVSLSAFSSDTI